MIIIVFYSYIFPLYIYTLLFWQRKKNKKVGTIISVFQNYFWGYAGVRLVNVKWMTDTYFMDVLDDIVIFILRSSKN